MQSTNAPAAPATTTPAAAPAVAKPAAKAATPAAAKRAVKAPAKASAKAPTKAAAKPVVPVKAAAAPSAVSKKTAAKPNPAVAKSAAAEKAAKVKQVKMVRDSFTFPKPEFAVLEALKLRSAKLAVPVKKTELVRAGIKALAAMGDANFLAAIRAVPNLKTGRPAKS